MPRYYNRGRRPYSTLPPAHCEYLGRRRSAPGLYQCRRRPSHPRHSHAVTWAVLDPRVFRSPGPQAYSEAFSPGPWPRTPPRGSGSRSGASCCHTATLLTRWSTATRRRTGPCAGLPPRESFLRVCGQYAPKIKLIVFAFVLILRAILCGICVCVLANLTHLCICLWGICRARSSFVNWAHNRPNDDLTRSNQESRPYVS